MLAYTLEEAETLLGDKLDAAQSSLANCQEDLDFLREQITVCLKLLDMSTLKAELTRLKTMEVATARVYNWDVNQRRLEKQSEGGSGGNEGKDMTDG
jgi:hypothetical protein